MTPDETHSQPDHAKPTASLPPLPGDFSNTLGREEATGSHATRSQLTPTPSVPHLSSSQDFFLTPPGYTITGELGHGGMGIVYAATDDRLKRAVALKMLLAGKHDSQHLIRFLIEAEAMARVRHPNVVQVFEAGENGGQPFLALEFLAGGTLSAKLNEGRPPLREALELMLKIARGVEAAHRQGVIHRDLKPGNVMFDAAGEPKVTDFGLAKHGEQDLTATDVMMGTPAYMAPEQAKGETKLAGPPADVYALGVMLYQMTTGTRPFTGDSPATVVYKVIHEMPEPPRRREASIPRDVEIITLKCLEKDPRHRYADAGLLADDLQRFLADEPISARPVGRLERGVKWVRRNRVVAGSLLVASLALVIGSVVSYVKYLDAKTQQGIANQKTGLAVEKEGIANRKTLEAQAAYRAEADRVRERDAALDDAKYQLSLGNMLLAVSARDNHDISQTRERLARVRPVQQGWEWRHLRRQIAGGIFTLAGHGDEVGAIAHSPDGSRIVTGSADQTARVWSARTGALLLELKGHANAVSGVAFSPDGLRVVTGSWDKTARVWDARTGTMLREITGHADWVTSVAFSPDGARVVTGSSDRTARVWEAKTGRPVAELKGHAEWVWSVAFSPDGLRVVTGSWDKTARVWDARTGALISELKGHADKVTGVAYSPDGSRIVTASWDRTARVFDARTAAPLVELKGHTDRLWGAAFSPEGSRIVTAGWDRTVRVWEAKTGGPLAVLTGHTDVVRSAAFSPDGSRIASGSDDRTAKVWDATTGAPVTRLRGHREKVSAAGISPEGARIVTGSQDKTAKIWEAKSGDLLVEFKGHADWVTAVAFHPDGSRVVSAGADQTAKIWNARTGELIREFKGHTALVSGVTFSPDGSRIVTGSWDKTARVWNAVTGGVITELTGHADRITGVAVSPDGRRIVTASDDLTARVWDAGTGDTLLELKGHTDKVTGVAFSPDGSRVVTTGADRTAKIWNATTGHIIIELTGHTDRVWSAAFSPDGRRVVTAGDDQTARIWDAQSGTPLMELTGHANVVNAVAFSPDGSTIVTGGNDRTARVWDGNTGEDNSLEYSLIHTRPNEWHYREGLEAALAGGDPFAAAFYRDRLLSNPARRTTANLQERLRAPASPAIIARTTFHHPELSTTPYDRGVVQALAVTGDRLARRLVAQECLREGKPGMAVPLLLTGLADRPANAPPVEELLLARAYLSLNDRPNAERFHRAAAEWLDRPQWPTRAIRMVAGADGWGRLGDLFTPVNDPRYNPFDWEPWHECDTFRLDLEKAMATRAGRWRSQAPWRSSERCFRPPLKSVESVPGCVTLMLSLAVPPSGVTSHARSPLVSGPCSLSPGGRRPGCFAGGFPAG